MNETSPKALSVRPAFGFSWPLIVGLLVCIKFLYSIQSELLHDPDTYLHISIGRWILLHHAVPSVDVFSYTKLGEPWVAHEWLAGVVFALCYQWTGWTGLVLLAILVMASTLAYQLRHLLAYLEPIHALFFTALTYFALAGHLLVRPHVLAWPLLAIWVCQLVKAVENRRAPPLWLLGVMVLWANLHGGFTLGLALEIPFFLDAVCSAPKQARGETAKHWIRFMLASGLAAMITPSGWHGIFFTLHVMNLEYLQHIQEWMPPKSVSLWFMEGWVALLLALAATGRLRMSLWRLLPLLGLLHLALGHFRNISIFSLLAPLFLAAPLARHWYATQPQASQAESLDRLFRALAPKASWYAVLLAGTVIAGIALSMDQKERYQPGIAISPAQALQAAKDARLEGNVFNEYGFGGFLVFHGIPVFVDGRADLYGNAFLKKYAEATDGCTPEKLAHLLDEYRIGWTLLQAGSPAARQMENLPGWLQIHADKIAVVHKRL